MRRVLGILRRGLKIMGWMGVSLSALLFVATVVLWVRSYRLPDAVYRRVREEQRQGEWGYTMTRWLSERGRLRCTHVRQISEIRYQEPGRVGPTWTRSNDVFNKVGYFFDSRADKQTALMRAGFVWQPHHEGLWYGSCVLSVDIFAAPHWFFAAVFGLWPSLFLARRLLRRKRYGPGMCPNCGYDLRATPERCPECGRVVEKRPAGSGDFAQD